MATTDVFSNPSNDYVNPGLAPCAGTSDTFKFEFLPKKDVGIISGSNIVNAMDLSNISIPITGWVEEKKTLESGEVIYIPGLEKGLLNRTQIYDIPRGAYNEPTGTQGACKYFYSVDMSINYYYNFRYYDINLEASANYGENIDIDNAINLALSAANISTTCTYDPSYFKFVGNTPGWDYDITKIQMTLIDQADASTSPFESISIDGEKITRTFALAEDETGDVPSAKYPNGAMLGYVMKAIYPSTAGVNDQWVYTNNVESPFTIYEPTTLSALNNVALYESLNFDTSLFNNMFDASSWSAYVSDVSIADVSIGTLPVTWDPSVYNMTVDASDISAGHWILDSSIIDSSISNSFIKNTDVSSALPVTIQDSSIILSYIKGNVAISGSKIQDSSIIDSSTQYSMSITNTTLENVTIDPSGLFITGSTLLSPSKTGSLTYSNVYQSSLQYYSIIDTSLQSVVISDSSIFGGDASLSIIGDSSIWGMNIFDSSIVNCYILDSSLDTVFIDSSDGTVVSQSYVSNSVMSNIVLNNDTSVWDSSIYNSWTNMFYPPDGAWDLWIADLTSTRMYINDSEIFDTSINNTWVYRSTIYGSDVEDSSLIGCIVYNTDIDSKSTYTDCSIYTLNAEWDTSILSETTSGTYYLRKSKKVDVGRSGSGSETILSAAEYLDYINTDSRWNKVGPFAAQISADDPANSTVKNLIGGFYVYNPHTFPVQVEYMLINN